MKRLAWIVGFGILFAMLGSAMLIAATQVPPCEKYSDYALNQWEERLNIDIPTETRVDWYQVVCDIHTAMATSRKSEVIDVEAVETMAVLMNKLLEISTSNQWLDEAVEVDFDFFRHWQALRSENLRASVDWNSLKVWESAADWDPEKERCHTWHPKDGDVMPRCSRISGATPDYTWVLSSVFAEPGDRPTNFELFITHQHSGEVSYFNLWCDADPIRDMDGCFPIMTSAKEDGVTTIWLDLGFRFSPK